MNVSQAVRAGVSASQEDHLLVPRCDGPRPVEVAGGYSTVLLSQVVHSQMDSVKLPPRYRQLAAFQSSNGKKDGVEIPADLGQRRGLAGVGAGSELDAFVAELGEAGVRS